MNTTVSEVTDSVLPFPFAAAFAHRPRRTFRSASKLQDELYEIRGPVHEHAARLEAEVIANT